jgi:hypothetical protein
MFDRVEAKPPRCMASDRFAPVASVGGSSDRGEVGALTQIHMPPVAVFSWKLINFRSKIRTYGICVGLGVLCVGAEKLSCRMCYLHV